MSAWTVDRDGRTLLGYSRRHGNHTLTVTPFGPRWRWVVATGIVVADGYVDGPIAGMEAADYALREVVR